jgi:hypothetical protein
LNGIADRRSYLTVSRRSDNVAGHRGRPLYLTDHVSPPPRGRSWLNLSSCALASDLACNRLAAPPLVSLGGGWPLLSSCTLAVGSTCSRFSALSLCRSCDAVRSGRRHAAPRGRVGIAEARRVQWEIRCGRTHLDGLLIVASHRRCRLQHAPLVARRFAQPIDTIAIHDGGCAKVAVGQRNRHSAHWCHRIVGDGVNRRAPWHHVGRQGATASRSPRGTFCLGRGPLVPAAVVVVGQLLCRGEVDAAELAVQRVLTGVVWRGGRWRRHRTAAALRPAWGKMRRRGGRAPGFDVRLNPDRFAVDPDDPLCAVGHQGDNGVACGRGEGQRRRAVVNSDGQHRTMRVHRSVHSILGRAPPKTGEKEFDLPRRPHCLRGDIYARRQRSRFGRRTTDPSVVVPSSTASLAPPPTLPPVSAVLRAPAAIRAHERGAPYTSSPSARPTTAPMTRPTPTLTTRPTAAPFRCGSSSTDIVCLESLHVSVQGGLDFKFSRWIVLTQSCRLASTRVLWQIVRVQCSGFRVGWILIFQDESCSPKVVDSPRLACLLANRANSVFRVQGGLDFIFSRLIGKVVDSPRLACLFGKSCEFSVQGSG